jgi:hypothetical protein
LEQMSEWQCLLHRKINIITSSDINIAWMNNKMVLTLKMMQRMQFYYMYYNIVSIWDRVFS